MARRIARVFAWAWDLAAGVARARNCNVESVKTCPGLTAQARLRYCSSGVACN